MGQRLYPVHRLDRATSGVIVMGLDSESAHELNTSFSEHRVRKRYLAIVRGWADAKGSIDRPVKDDERSEHREAKTDYERLAKCELPIANRRYPTSRYSLLALHPITGRRHQLRIHCERMAHPIIGDTTHGDGEHNKLFREHFDVHRLLLHAEAICLPHPADGQKMINITCPPTGEFLHVLKATGMSEA